MIFIFFAAEAIHSVYLISLFYMLKFTRHFLAIGAVCACLVACGKDGEPEMPDKPDTPSQTEKPDSEQPSTPEKPSEPETPSESDSPSSSVPADSEFKLKSSMSPDASLAGVAWGEIDTHMKKFMFEYTEHPNNSDKDHNSGTHGEVVYDQTLGQYVYKFSVHKNSDIIDGDRGTMTDRQRNEMKSRTGSNGYPEVNLNYDEWQRLEWKFKIPAGFQPSGQFTHIHQLKGADGSDNGSPVITISLRANSNGSNKRVEVIHTARSGGTSLGRIVDNIPLSDFEDEWVHVETLAHACRHGYYRIIVTRISDKKVLIDKEEKDIDMWRASGGTSIRNKYGIYRSVGGDPFGSNTLLKDEHIFLTDFKVYEANTNSDPKAVDD